jgi:hypothetical protein
MTENKDNTQPEPTVAIGCGLTLVNLIVIGAGAYRGYCDANGIPYDSEEMRLWLTWGPIILNSGYCGLTSIPGGAKSAETYGVSVRHGEAIEAVTGTIAGGAAAGIATLLCYGLGYGAGYISSRIK